MPIDIWQVSNSQLQSTVHGSRWLPSVTAESLSSFPTVMRRDMYDVASPRRQGMNVSSTSFRRFSDTKSLLRKGRQDGYSFPPQDLLLGLLLPLWRSPATVRPCHGALRGDRSPNPQNLLGDASAGERACHRSIVRSMEALAMRHGVWAALEVWKLGGSALRKPQGLFAAILRWMELADVIDHDLAMISQ